MGTLGKAAWKLIKMLLNSKIRGKAVRLMDVYSLALSEMSNALGKPPPPDATIVSETEKIRERLPEALSILEQIPAQEYNIENPVQAMRLFSVSLETGIERKMPLSARTLQQIDGMVQDPELSAPQKEKILHLAIDSYLNGLLAPVMQLDLFTQKLDDLLLETRCKTREEMMVLLREEIAKTQLAEALLKKLQAQQQSDLQKNRRKAPLTLADKVMIINKAFKSLEDIGAKHSFTQRTIQNWDNGKCPYDGYSPLFNELELLAWANKKVGEIRSKQALSNLVRGMSEDEMSRRAGKR